MQNMPYLPVIQALQGRGAQLEIGDPSRPSVEVVTGVIWGTFADNEITLVVTFSDRNIETPADPKADIKTLPGPKFEPVREFSFKWIRTANVISVVSDANVMVNIAKRAIKRMKADPLYTDDLPQWSVLNNHLAKHVNAQLLELGFVCGTEAFKNDNNEPISEETAFPPMAVAASPVETKPESTPDATSEVKKS